MYSKGFNNCYILLSNISESLENTKFVAGDLSFDFPLCYIFPYGFMNPDKGKYKGKKIL